jgi:hypothetical protein
MNAVADINIETTRLTKQGFIAGRAATVAMAGGVVLGIRLRFHNHPPQQRTIGLALHQQATDELVGDDLSRAGEELAREVIGERGGYGSDLVRLFVCT